MYKLCTVNTIKMKYIINYILHIIEGAYKIAEYTPLLYQSIKQWLHRLGIYNGMYRLISMLLRSMDYSPVSEAYSYPLVSYCVIKLMLRNADKKTMADVNYTLL